MVPAIGGLLLDRLVQLPQCGARRVPFAVLFQLQAPRDGDACTHFVEQVMESVERAAVRFGCSSQQLVVSGGLECFADFDAKFARFKDGLLGFSEFLALPALLAAMAIVAAPLRKQSNNRRAASQGSCGPFALVTCQSPSCILAGI